MAGSEPPDDGELVVELDEVPLKDDSFGFPFVMVPSGRLPGDEAPWLLLVVAAAPPLCVFAVVVLVVPAAASLACLS